LGILYCWPQFSEAPELLRLWNACQLCILPVKPLDLDLSLNDGSFRGISNSRTVPQPVIAIGFIGASAGEFA
jgi:hypothetical protein